MKASYLLNIESHIYIYVYTARRGCFVGAGTNRDPSPQFTLLRSPFIMNVVHPGIVNTESVILNCLRVSVCHVL